MTRLFTPAAIGLLMATSVQAQSIQDGLVLQMDFDNEIRVHGNNAFETDTHGVAIVSDRYGRENGAVRFDGDSSLISIEDTSALHLQLPFTMALWAYCDTVDGSEMFISTDNDPSTYSGVTFGLNGNGSGKVTMSIGDGRFAGSQTRRTLLSNDTIKAGQWHHYVAIFNDVTDMELYVDGEKWEGTYSGTGLSTIGYTSAPIYIGANNGAFGGWQHFKGSMDNIRIWNRALTSERAKTLYRGDGMISYLSMDGHGEDLTEYEIDGEVLAMAAEDRHMEANSALEFDGAGDNYVEFPDSDTLELQPPFSIALWVYNDSIDVNTNIWVDTDDDHVVYSGFNLGLQNNSGQVSMSTGDGRGAGSQYRRSFITTDSIVKPETWHHVVAVVRSATDMEAWVDGIKYDGTHSGTGLTSIAYTDSPMRLGTNGNPWGSPRYFDGKMDDFRMYSYALNQAQIENLYQPVEGSLTTSLVARSSKNNARIYPNPANDFLNVAGYQGQISTMVYNALGAVVAQGADRLDLTGLEDGVYLVQVQDAAGISVMKLVKR